MKIKICPKCRSKEIEIVKEGKYPGMPYFPYGAPVYYCCKKCKYTSTLFPEKEMKKGKKDYPNTASEKNK